MLFVRSLTFVYSHERRCQRERSFSFALLLLSFCSPFPCLSSDHLLSRLRFPICKGWKSANFIVPLVLSAVLLVAFFFWESRLDENHVCVLSLPLLPPWVKLLTFCDHSPQALFPLVTFSYPNVPIIMFASLAAYAWWATTQLQFARYYQEVAHYSPILTAVHMWVHSVYLSLLFSISVLTSVVLFFHSLPQGITSLFVGSLLTGAFPKALGYPRELLPGGIILGAVGMTLLIFSDGHKYWPFVFPGFIIGRCGLALPVFEVGLFFS